MSPTPKKPLARPRYVRADTVTAHLRFGAPVATGEDRKALAARLHCEVVALKNQLSNTRFTK